MAAVLQGNLHFTCGVAKGVRTKRSRAKGRGQDRRHGEKERRETAARSVDLKLRHRELPRAMDQERVQLSDFGNNLADAGCRTDGH
jgi:hypothetical protein